MDKEPQPVRYPKRLIEVDLPIARISAHARREKSIRHGHISTLHIWWARRPLAACRAVICASLWPDPADELCPQEFRDAAVEQITAFANRVFPKKLTAEGKLLSSEKHLSMESRARWEAIAEGTLTLDANEPSDLGVLRLCLLDFIADFANWDNSTVSAFLETSNALTGAAHQALGGAVGTRPLVVDPFAGGGSIPLEILRAGADAFATDLNPIPVLLNKVLLEYLPKYKNQLIDAIGIYAETVKAEIEKGLSDYYPQDPDGAVPIAYLWARTVLSEAPGQNESPVEVPMLRSMWICSKSSRKTALRWKRDSNGEIETKEIKKTFSCGNSKLVRQPQLEIFEVKRDSEVEQPTVARGSVTCPITGFTTPVASVRTQLESRLGGAQDGRLYCVVVKRPGTTGRSYRIATDSDIELVESAKDRLESLSNSNDSIDRLPDETLPLMSGVFNAPIYGHSTWGSLFNPRQALLMLTVSRIVRDLDLSDLGDRGLERAVRTCLAFGVGRCANQFTSLCKWNPGRELVDGVFARQAIPMLWDYGEINVLEGESYWTGAINWILAVLKRNQIGHQGQSQLSDAAQHILPSDSALAVFTDPPYYNAVPYADLSDFFYVWQKRILSKQFPELFNSDLAPKEKEICEMAGWDAVRYSYKTGVWFEDQMQKAMCEARRVLTPDGIGIVVFAHKSTGGWESQLQAMCDAGWTITASWPVDTEMGNRLRAMNSAALASSVHLVCRPRELADGTLKEQVGEWRDVLAELPKRIHEWMPRLSAEGVVGADAIFACLGPALEVFSRYSRVEKASGDTVPLREYLEQVWAAVSTEALSMIFKDADAAGLEPDARISAMWLWTLGAGAGDSNGNGSDDKVVASKGYTLEFDAARKIAQGLGIHLEESESIVEVKGDKARLLPVSERTKYLFGKKEADATTARGRRKKKEQQRQLFEELDELEAEANIAGELKPQAGETVLDRVHQSMILFASGRGEALKRFLVEDGAGNDARFWKLAQSLSALYPKETDEKRWVDGVLARKKGLGL